MAVLAETVFAYRRNGRLGGEADASARRPYLCQHPENRGGIRMYPCLYPLRSRLPPVADGLRRPASDQERDISSPSLLIVTLTPAGLFGNCMSNERNDCYEPT